MKEEFKWYFPLSGKEIEYIWKNGMLTVDTNVLLDLYRYHKNTRRTLLDSLNSFKGRAWISYQVADEFFRNRNKVILSATGAFNEAERMINDLKKAIEEPLNKLKSNRIIPDELEDKLEKAINVALNEAGQGISKIRSEYPNYRTSDPILDSVCNLFNSSVGSPFTKDELPDIIKEAKRRKESKIPPGFLDSNKDGDRPFGDYFVWKQIINQVKTVGKPLIFVTSEQKEDWWERAAGQTTGPLYELLKEFFQETQQRFLFYRTDRFLEDSIKRSGRKANVNAVNEIRDVASQRFRESPLVKILLQTPQINRSDTNCGTLKVELLEPTYMFTCSGHFSPVLNGIPTIQGKLIKYPESTPAHTLRFGTGTIFDFHVHLRSTDHGFLFPIGEYIFEYEAIFKQQ
jgi:hypothetical protein